MRLACGSPRPTRRRSVTCPGRHRRCRRTRSEPAASDRRPDAGAWGLLLRDDRKVVRVPGRVADGLLDAVVRDLAAEVGVAGVADDGAGDLEAHLAQPVLG